MLKNLFIKVLFIWVSLVSVVFANLDINQTSQGGVVQFDNGNGNYLSIPTMTFGEVTMEMWINYLPQTTQEYTKLFEFGNSSSDHIELTINSDARIFTNSSLTPAISIGEWNHIAMSVDSSGNAKIYINGELGISDTITITNTIREENYIHKSYTEHTQNNLMCDEVRIWNIVRTSAEINSTMNKQLDGNESGLVAYYNFDETVGTKIVDVASGDYNATIEGNVTRLNFLGDGLSFDGVDDYVEIAQTNSLDLSGNSNFTISAWVKTSMTTKGAIFENLSDNVGEFNIYASIDTNKASFQAWEEGGTVNQLLSNSTINDNNWHYVTFIKDSDFYKVYINGVLENSTTFALSSAITNTHVVTIGRVNRTGGSEYFNGNINEVSIWNRVLSESEIQEYMHIPLIGNESGLIGYWPLSEGDGNISYDRSSYGNDGNITGAEWNSSAPIIYGNNLYTQNSYPKRVKLNIENNISTPTLTIPEAPINGTVELNSTLREYIYTPINLIDDSFIINANDGSSEQNITVNVKNRRVIDNVTLNINLTNTTLSEHNITNIQIYGVDGTDENLSIPDIVNIVDGDNNYSVPIYNPENNFSIIVDVNNSGFVTSWYYNFTDGKFYLENNLSSDFKTEINSTNNLFTMNLNSSNWESKEPSILFLNSTVDSVTQKYSFTSTYDEAVLNIFNELYLTKYNTSYVEKVDNSGVSLWSNTNSSSDITTDFINAYTEGWGGPLNKYFDTSTALLTDSTNAHGYYIEADEDGAVYILINGGGVKRMNPAFGSIDWTFNAYTDLGLSDAISSDIKYRDGYVYIIGVDWNTRYEVFIYKIDASNGAKIWRYDYSASANAQDGVLAITDEYVYASFANSKTIQLNIDSGMELNSTTYISKLASDGKYLYGNSGNIKKFDSTFGEMADLGTGKIVYFRENGYVKYDSGTHYIYETNSSSIDVAYNLGTQTIKLLVADKEFDSLDITVFNSDTSIATVTENWTNPTTNGVLELSINPLTTTSQSTYLEFTISDGVNSIDKNLTINFIKKDITMMNLIDTNLSEHNITSIRLYGVDGNSEDLYVYKEGEIRSIVDGDNNYSFPLYNLDSNFSLEFNVNKYGVETDWYYNFSDGKLYPENNGSGEFKREINSTENIITVNTDILNWSYYQFSGLLGSNDKNVTSLTLWHWYNSTNFGLVINAGSTFSFDFSEDGDYTLALKTDDNLTWYYDFATNTILSTDSGTALTLSSGSNYELDINISKVWFDDYNSSLPEIIYGGEEYNLSESVYHNNSLTLEKNATINTNGYSLIVTGDLNLGGKITGSPSVTVKGDTYLTLNETTDSTISNAILSGDLYIEELAGESSFYHPTISKISFISDVVQNVYMNLPWWMSFNSMEFNNSVGVNFYLNNLGTMTYSYYQGLYIYGSFIQNNTSINIYDNGALISNTPKFSYLDYSPSYTYQFMGEPQIERLYLNYNEVVDFNFSANEIVLYYSYDLNSSGEINSVLPSVTNLISAESTYNSLKYSLSITSNSNYELNLTKLPNYNIEYINFNNLRGNIKDLSANLNGVNFYNVKELNITNSDFNFAYMDMDESNISLKNSNLDINGSLWMWDSNLTLINSNLFTKYLYMGGDSNYTKDTTSSFSFIYSDTNLISDTISLNFSVDKTSLNFGSIDVGGSVTQSIIVTNLESYEGSVNFSPNSNAFILNNSNCNLIANGNCEVQVTFNPSLSGSYNNTLTITSGENVEIISLVANANIPYIPPITTTPIPESTPPATIEDNTQEFIDNIEIVFDIEEPVNLSEGGDLGDLGIVSESEDGTKTFDIKYDTGTEVEVKASIEVSEDGTSNSKISITDESGNIVETSVDLPEGTETTLTEDGSIEQILKTETGTETKVKTSPKGEVDVKFKSADGKDISLKAPAGAKTLVNKDGSLSQNLDTKEVKAEIKASADGKTEVKVENIDGDSVGLELEVEAETELKADGSIVQKMTSEDGKSTEVQASKRAEVKAVIESPTGESLQLNPPKGANVKVNADNSISITNQAMTNDGFVNSEMKVNADGTSSVDVTIDSNQRGVAPKKLTYSTRKDISNAKLEVILDERTELSRTLKTTASKGGRVKATFSTRREFSYKSSNLRAIEDFNVDISPEIDAKFEENLYFNEKSDLKLSSGKANIKAIFSTRSTFDNKERDISDKLQSTRRSFNIRADKSLIEDSGKVTASLTEESSTTTIEADSENMEASIFTLNKSLRDIRGKVTGKKLIYSVRKEFSDVKLEAIEDSNFRVNSKVKLKAIYSTRSLFSFKDSNSRELNEIVIIPSEDANFTEEINRDGTRSIRLTSGSATINDKEMELNTPYELPPLEGIEVTQNVIKKQNITLLLSKWWNLISSPIAEDISDKFIFGNYDVIWNYKNNQWYKNPNMIYYDEGFWIKSNIAQNVDFSGENYISNLKVIPIKWALIGIGERVEDISNFLIENRIKEIYMYKDSNWSNSSTINTIEVGRGLWIEKEEPNYLLSLIKGWNLASLPTNETVSDISIFGDYDDIMTYENGEWFKNPEIIKPMEGFWIKMNENLKIAFYGESYKLNTSLLNDGWSLVGGVVDNLNENDIVWLFKNSKWIEIDSSTLDLIEVGNGIWIKK